MEKIIWYARIGGTQTFFWSGTPTISSETPTFCQMGVLNSCFQNPSESSDFAHGLVMVCILQQRFQITNLALELKVIYSCYIF